MSVESGHDEYRSEIYDHSTRRLLPVRYSIKETEKRRFLTCVDSPNIAVQVARDFNVSLAAAKKYPECTIFLDGAVNGEPFMDVQRRIYNLDHHEGCVRAFTIASCEQAAVIVMKGLDLGGEQWTVYANEPDLDTVLAIWVLLNNVRFMEDDAKLRARVLPIVRLQGVIDAHGFELQALTGFDEYSQTETLNQIELLRTEELRLKREEQWSKSDPLEYTLQTLQLMDDLVYTPDDFGVQTHVDELVRAPLTADKIAIACESELGIYELEQHLKSQHRERLGVIILQKDPSTFTIRQVDPFLPKTLEPVYDRLNQLDPTVGIDSRWGGSSDIGGSPRGRGSRLSAEQIVDACNWVHRTPAPLQRFLRVVASLFAPVLVSWGLLVLAIRGWPKGGLPGQLVGSGSTGYGAFSIVMTAVALGLLLILARKESGRFGLRSPTGWGWLGWMPVAALAALAGGSWTPSWLVGTGHPSLGWPFALVIALGAVGTEMMFRGIVHGVLTREFNIQYPGGRRFLSAPNVVSALAYATTLVVLFAPPNWVGVSSNLGLPAVAWAAAAILMGLTTGFVRERSGSIVAAIVVQVLFASALWFLAPLLGTVAGRL